MGTALNLQNYSHGFLVHDDLIAGVTELSGGVFSAYIANADTTETVFYKEFSSAEDALSELSSRTEGWVYEGVGCSSHQKSVQGKETCGGCSGGCS